MSVESRREGRAAGSATEFSGGRVAAIARDRAWLGTLGVVGLFAAAFLIHLWLARKIVSPWIVSDEYTYARAARDAAANGFSGLFSDIPTTFPGHLPAPDLAGVAALRLSRNALRRRQGHQRPADDFGGRLRVRAWPSLPRAPVRAHRGGADVPPAAAPLLGRPDDRERVLPRVHALDSRDRGGARAADADTAAARLRPDWP